jgi:hypothetical protein
MESYYQMPQTSNEDRVTIWLFKIAMENGPFIDGLPGFTY